MHVLSSCQPETEKSREAFPSNLFARSSLLFVLRSFGALMPSRSTLVVGRASLIVALIVIPHVAWSATGRGAVERAGENPEALPPVVGSLEAPLRRQESGHRRGGARHGGARHGGGRKGVFDSSMTALWGDVRRHAFSTHCPGAPCRALTPIGAAFRVGMSHEWSHFAVGGFGLALLDYSWGSFTRRTRVSVPQAGLDGVVDGQGQLSGNATGFGAALGPDGLTLTPGELAELGIDLGGELSGDSSANGQNMDRQEIREQQITASVLRYGAGLGVSARAFSQWGRFGVFGSGGAGFLRRGAVWYMDGEDAIVRAYTTPFVMGDLGIRLGRSDAFTLALTAYAEWPSALRADGSSPKSARWVARAPTYFLGPTLGIEFDL